jgi:hypothetical protein
MTQRGTSNSDPLQRAVDRELSFLRDHIYRWRHFTDADDPRRAEHIAEAEADLALLEERARAVGLRA